MRKNLRAVLAFLLVVLIIQTIIIAGCIGETENNENIALRLEQYESKLGELEKLLIQTNDKLKVINDENLLLKKEIDDLNKDCEFLLKKVIEANDENNFKQGTFLSLNDAYNDGLLSKKDLMHISYNLIGEVYEPLNEYDWGNKDTWQKIDFIPEHLLNRLCIDIKYDIFISYVLSYIDAFIDSDGNLHGGVSNLTMKDFLGEYNGSYVVRIDCDLWDVGQGTTKYNVGGIMFEYGSPSIQVFTYKNNN